jgi:hypothetical protein
VSWETAKQLVKARAHGHCEGCGYPGLDVHHRQPRGMGGVHGQAVAAAHHVTNLLLLCRLCHDWTEAQPADARVFGFLVAHPTVPATVSAKLWTVNGKGWWFLTDDAGYRWDSDATA